MAKSILTCKVKLAFEYDEPNGCVIVWSEDSDAGEIIEVINVTDVIGATDAEAKESAVKELVGRYGITEYNATSLVNGLGASDEEPRMVVLANGKRYCECGAEWTEWAGTPMDDPSDMDYFGPGTTPMSKSNPGARPKQVIAPVGKLTCANGHSIDIANSLISQVREDVIDNG